MTLPEQNQNQRVLLTLKLMDGSLVDAELGRKAATLMMRQEGVKHAEGGKGSLEIRYDPLAITLSDMLKLLSRANIRAGIS